MDMLKGKTLVKADGSEVEADVALANKGLILYYFSAHWCPPCRGFTPILKDFYQEVSEDLEIVFVSADQSPEDMYSYMKESHGDWVAVQHESDLSKQLDQKFQVEGIPTLVVCKNDGTIISEDGTSDVRGKQPKQVVSAWKK